MKRALAFALLAAISCGRSDDGSSAASSTSPVAVAGDDRKAIFGALVTLDGSKSAPAGEITYLWEQIGGTAVALSDATIAQPTFDAPTLVAPATEEELTFRLTVTSAGGSDADTVSVVVKKIVLDPLEAWFVGYGASGTLAASATGGSGAYTFTWSGLNEWLEVSGADGEFLDYATPLFSDFQELYGAYGFAGVIALKAAAQGRLQFKLKATDKSDSTATDEEYVNFSVGPLGTCVGQSVAPGEPVFLGAGGWLNPSWTGTNPDGSQITFMRPDKTTIGTLATDRVLYFVPARTGTYQVILDTNGGALPQVPPYIVFDITCADYVGTGTLLGKTPDPSRGECAACHEGDLPDLTVPWAQTKHATAFSRLLDPTDPYFAAFQATGRWQDAFDFGSAYSIDARTTGFGTVQSPSYRGWTQLAAAEGYSLAGTSWSELKRRNPGTASMSNVQCESCHGPGGAHAGDTRGISKNLQPELCGRCHDREHSLWLANPFPEQASEQPHHGILSMWNRTTRPECNNCHTAQGAIAEIEGLEGTNPPVAFAPVANDARPALFRYQVTGITCQACHDPHRKTPGRPATGTYDPQLRVWGRIKLRNDAVVEAGEAALCYLCHQGFRDTRPGSADFDSRKAPHNSTSAEMLDGTNGMHFAGWTYNVSPHGIPDRFIAPGRTENRRCLTCHSDVQPAAGTLGHGALGGHSFNVRQGMNGTVASAGSHGPGGTVPGSKRFTFTDSYEIIGNVLPGDTLTIDGPEAGTYTIVSVDNARQVTVKRDIDFTTNAVTSWSIFSTLKYNSAACAQCHVIGAGFRSVARGDYDGDGAREAVQDEIDGLMTDLRGTIDAELKALLGAPSAYFIYTFYGGDLQVEYFDGAFGVRAFPGPGVDAAEWDALPLLKQVKWTNLYKAAYNYFFVQCDRSRGVHNTGYAVDLLQSSIKALDASAAFDPFVPYP